jgi:hypothetical protein
VQVAMSFASDVHDPIARIMVTVANAVSNSTYTATVSKAASLCESHRASLLGCAHTLAPTSSPTVPFVFCKVRRAPTNASWYDYNSDSERALR